MSQRKTVALFVETASHYGRQLLQGMLRFKTEVKDWQVLLEERELESLPSLWLSDRNFDGIICRQTTPEISQTALERGIPFVELNDRLAEPVDLVSLRSDDAAIGTLAAEHFLDRGFRHFAYCGVQHEAWSDRRGSYFRQRVEADDLACQWLDLSWYLDQTAASAASNLLLQWLGSLPRPAAIFCANDMRAKHVLDACIQLDLAVPEQIAVLGVDNDDLICNFCEPTLSSVIPNSEELGYRAARALDRLMRGKEVSPLLQLIDPLDVRVRESTDTHAIADPQLVEALVFIRNHACEGITVEDVVEAVSLSRSSLERRMRKSLGRTPQKEVRRVQLNRAKKLLSDTDVLIDAIATQCGFERPEYLHVLFKRQFKMTPGEYRRLARR